MRVGNDQPEARRVCTSSRVRVLRGEPMRKTEHELIFDAIDEVFDLRQEPMPNARVNRNRNMARTPRRGFHWCDCDRTKRGRGDKCKRCGMRGEKRFGNACRDPGSLREKGKDRRRDGRGPRSTERRSERPGDGRRRQGRRAAGVRVRRARVISSK